MDAIADEITVRGGDSITATRRSARPMKPTAKLQENLQATEKTDATRNRRPHRLNEGGNGCENGLTKRAGEPQMTAEGAMGNNASLMQLMLRAMKKMLERLWDTLMENKRTATQMMSEQLEMIRQLQQEMIRQLQQEMIRQLQQEMIRQLQQEIQTIKAQAAEELKKTDEQCTRQLEIMREQTSPF
ncbi:unnamed protein product [Clonostachys rhizophaga]|uniref:Uncharacterized protein n=1 Tax=Clonostachys rhizophaga TaxID=160324 RepID=A0A9N9VC32_9HYPO|nr:unnamed protein product [Clonostachys rhizophaga]